jgi:Transglutaminase-like superfamily
MARLRPHTLRSPVENMSIMVKVSDSARRVVDSLGCVRTILRIERARRSAGPLAAAALARSLGKTADPRWGADRARLRRYVSRVDSLFPGGPNCYRRALLEMAFDRGAAAETLQLGLSASGGPGSGHAWLSSETPTGSYDVTLSI